MLTETGQAITEDLAQWSAHIPDLTPRLRVPGHAGFVLGPIPPVTPEPLGTTEGQQRTESTPQTRSRLRTFSDLAVSSHRAIEESSPSGGMATAVHQALNPPTNGNGTLTSMDIPDYGAIHGFRRKQWAGWDGVKNRTDGVTEAEHKTIRTASGAVYERISIPFSKTQYENNYLGFDNSLLWPVMHGFVEKSHFKPEWWTDYVDANRRFAKEGLENTSPRTLHWIQDYHLMLFAKELHGMEENGQPADRPMAYFHHIPWPEPKDFAVIPELPRRAILEGLIHFNQVGFHTEEYAQNFLRCVGQFLPEADIEVTPHGIKVSYDGQSTIVASFPIGIDTGELERQAASPEVQAEALTFRAQYPDHKVIFNAARRDYMKGFEEGLAAMEVAFEKYKDMRDGVVYVMGDQPSRAGIEEYDELDSKIVTQVTQINLMANRNPQLVVREPKGFKPWQMQARLQESDVLFIPSIIDGFNLVLPEFFTLNRRNGIAVASEHMGAMEIYGDCTLGIDPKDTTIYRYKAENIADRLYEAVTMPEKVRKALLEEAKARAQDKNVHKWARQQWELMRRITV